MSLHLMGIAVETLEAQHGSIQYFPELDPEIVCVMV